MKKRITYFDPRVVENDPDGQEITVYAVTQDEYDATMAAITDPSREIPQDSIVVTDAPPGLPTESQRLAAIESAIMDMAGEIYG